MPDETAILELAKEALQLAKTTLESAKTIKLKELITLGIVSSIEEEEGDFYISPTAFTIKKMMLSLQAVKDNYTKKEKSELYSSFDPSVIIEIIQKETENLNKALEENSKLMELIKKEEDVLVSALEMYKKISGKIKIKSEIEEQSKNMPRKLQEFKDDIYLWIKQFQETGDSSKSKLDSRFDIKKLEIHFNEIKNISEEELKKIKLKIEKKTKQEVKKNSAKELLEAQEELSKIFQEMTDAGGTFKGKRIDGGHDPDPFKERFIEVIKKNNFFIEEDKIIEYFKEKEKISIEIAHDYEENLEDEFEQSLDYKIKKTGILSSLASIKKILENDGITSDKRHISIFDNLEFIKKEIEENGDDFDLTFEDPKTHEWILQFLENPLFILMEQEAKKEEKSPPTFDSIWQEAVKKESFLKNKKNEVKTDNDFLDPKVFDLDEETKNLLSFIKKNKKEESENILSYIAHRITKDPEAKKALQNEFFHEEIKRKIILKRNSIVARMNEYLNEISKRGITGKGKIYDDLFDILIKDKEIPELIIFFMRQNKEMDINELIEKITKEIQKNEINILNDIYDIYLYIQSAEKKLRTVHYTEIKKELANLEKEINNLSDYDSQKTKDILKKAKKINEKIDLLKEKGTLIKKEEIKKDTDQKIDMGELDIKINDNIIKIKISEIILKEEDLGEKKEFLNKIKFQFNEYLNNFSEDALFPEFEGFKIKGIKGNVINCFPVEHLQEIKRLNEELKKEKGEKKTKNMELLKKITDILNYSVNQIYPAIALYHERAENYRKFAEQKNPLLEEYKNSLIKDIENLEKKFLPKEVNLEFKVIAKEINSIDESLMEFERQAYMALKKDSILEKITISKKSQENYQEAIQAAQEELAVLKNQLHELGILENKKGTNLSKIFFTGFEASYDSIFQEIKNEIKNKEREIESLIKKQLDTCKSDIEDKKAEKKECKKKTGRLETIKNYIENSSYTLDSPSIIYGLLHEAGISSENPDDPFLKMDFLYKEIDDFEFSIDENKTLYKELNAFFELRDLRASEGFKTFIEEIVSGPQKENEKKRLIKNAMKETTFYQEIEKIDTLIRKDEKYKNVIGKNEVRSLLKKSFPGDIKWDEERELIPMLQEFLEQVSTTNKIQIKAAETTLHLLDKEQYRLEEQLQEQEKIVSDIKKLEEKEGDALLEPMNHSDDNYYIFDQKEKLLYPNTQKEKLEYNLQNCIAQIDPLKKEIERIDKVIKELINTSPTRLYKSENSLVKGYIFLRAYWAGLVHIPETTLIGFRFGQKFSRKKEIIGILEKRRKLLVRELAEREQEKASLEVKKYTIEEKKYSAQQERLAHLHNFFEKNPPEFLHKSIQIGIYALLHESGIGLDDETLPFHAIKAMCATIDTWATPTSDRVLINLTEVFTKHDIPHPKNFHGFSDRLQQIYADKGLSDSEKNSLIRENTKTYVFDTVMAAYQEKSLDLGYIQSLLQHAYPDVAWDATQILPACMQRLIEQMQAKTALQLDTLSKNLEKSKKEQEKTQAKLHATPDGAYTLTAKEQGQKEQFIKEIQSFREKLGCPLQPHEKTQLAVNYSLETLARHVGELKVANRTYGLQRYQLANPKNWAHSAMETLLDTPEPFQAGDQKAHQAIFQTWYGIDTTDLHAPKKSQTRWWRSSLLAIEKLGVEMIAVCRDQDGMIQVPDPYAWADCKRILMKHIEKNGGSYVQTIPGEPEIQVRIILNPHGRSGAPFEATCIDTKTNQVIPHPEIGHRAICHVMGWLAKQYQRAPQWELDGRIPLLKTIPPLPTETPRPKAHSSYGIKSVAPEMEMSKQRDDGDLESKPPPTISPAA